MAVPTKYEALQNILGEFDEELFQARRKFPPMDDPHYGYAVIKEEFDEMWDAIKENNDIETRKEAIQVGAMVLAFVLEVCDGYD